MFNNLNIGVRLGAGFGIIVLILVVAGSVGYWNINSIYDSSMEVITTDAYVAERAARVRAGINSSRRYEKDVIINVASPEKSAEYFKQWNEKQAAVLERADDMGKVLSNAKDKELIKDLKDQWGVYTKGFNDVYSQVRSGKLSTPALANEAMGPYKDSAHKAETLSFDFAELTKKRMDPKIAQLGNIKQHTSNIMLMFMAASVIIGIVVSALITRSITGPLKSAVAAANRLSDGDLTAEVDIRSNDEVGQLLRAMNLMAANLRGMVVKILGTSEQVASAAGEISANSAQLIKAAHAQASATDETSSTMVQMAASIQSVAGNADALASNAEEVASSIQQLGVSGEQVARNAEVMASSVTETSATIEQMTVSIEKVAQNTEELASSVTETSSTVEQMTVSIEQVAGNTQELQKIVAETTVIVDQMSVSIRKASEGIMEADSVAKTAAREGYSGQQAVQDALAAMKRVADISEKTAAAIINLGKRSEEIGNIVNVINEIADQTNLLALNAAIEAARAGDAGRGFAVVADEVRKLAERSVSATKEIGQVIKQVQADTDDTVKYGELASRESRTSMELSGVAGNALANIVKSIEQTSNLMSSIALMTAEQSEASDQVIRAVGRMNESTAFVASAAREQALGGRQIRVAVERMNNITHEVTGATREQAQGSRQIRIAVESMNNVTHLVTIATREQALSARQIAEVVSSMNTMTQSVANATSEQKKGGDMVVTAMENISDVTRENLVSVEQLARAAQSLSLQADDLSGLVAQFKVS